MQFNRQLYKQKPSAWGPTSSVQASIFKNAERIGIDPASIALAIPMWGPGDQLDYANINTCTNTASSFVNNALTFNGSTSYINCGNLLKYQITGSITLLSYVKHLTRPPYYGDLKDHIFNSFIGKGYDGSNEGYTLRMRNVSGSDTTLTVGAYQGLGNITYSISVDIDSLVSGATSLVGTMSSTSLQLFVNGTIRASGAGHAPFTTGSGLLIGATYMVGVPARFLNATQNGAYIFSTVLPSSQIAYLSDNPYFLLQRVAPVFYSVPGGGVPPTFNPLFLNAAQPTRVIQ